MMYDSPDSVILSNNVSPGNSMISEETITF